MPDSPQPDQVVNLTDTGDEVRRRFHCQDTYAAILAIDMLLPESEVQEILCEQHEDVLVKRKDAKFSGVQVKTRTVGQQPFKTMDDEIVTAIKRFVSMEQEYGAHVSQYVLATNCGFWHEKLNGSNLLHLLKTIKAPGAKIDDLKSAPFSKLAKKVLGSVSPDYALLFATLRKVDVQDIPGIADIESRLRDLVARLTQLKDRPYADIARVATALIRSMHDAANLSHQDARRDYFAVLVNPQQVRDRAKIDGKRISRELLERLIASACAPSVLLATHGNVSVAQLPKGMQVVEQKLAAGEVTVANVNLMKDHKYSAELLLANWLYKSSPEEADRRYQHVRTAVNTDCQEAHDATVGNGSEPYGQAMLKDVRARIHQRYEREKASLFDCSYEHLMGIAGVLTEDCTVWWSKPFNIVKENGSA
jgi:hypothetical protein